ncbi:HNH endonuclease [Crocosphaera sp. XPORK-15E]|uniref:HNH endonuclease n=1 Tax=Crocosphaera sp. XPORK-15E TaxID=3110247 RepID=UPI002B21766A|nr:HNH endonuclease [Crocosphaera sp. XPORK-15E]MEA5534054.1 HNH endonuclease [Crocosphaera sp. XPORK-15E]
MRPVIRGEAKDENTGNSINFQKYGDAKPYLLENIGEYCSYCERKVNNLLAVEHIKPKEYYPALELVWDNFLLACTNCNSIKGQKTINLSDYFWCDHDNTFLAFTYANGLIKINDNLTETQKEISQKTIELTGLDRVPGHPNYSRKDQRWKERQDKWGKAQRAYNNLQKNDIEEQRQTIIDLALESGFWSIWMTVFRDDKDMLERFIKAFPGTCQDFFDQDFNVVPRPGGAL